MASAPQTYKRGSQDIRENKATFALFWTLTKVSLIFLVILMALMAYFLT
ncbi:MAG: aa3-type cytochrome c oxidase subunit IV [Alphaproteobacteria bacterium]|nr:aa3-type cytochrome c oxidase subunit IV [Alphaproteobacteria bacterium]